MSAALWRLAKFALIGGLLTGLNYLTYSALLLAGVNYGLAATAGWAVGLTLSFVLNKRYTFALRTAATAKEVWAFLGTYLLQYVIGISTLALLVSGFGVPPRPAFVINLLVTAAISFALMRWIVFRPPAGVQTAGARDAGIFF